MKKIFLFIAMLSVGFAASAQSATLMPTVVGDTIGTSASLDTVFKNLPATAGYSTLAFQINGTKISGTITSKAYLYSSLDGVKYNLTDSTAAFANSSGLQAVWILKTGGVPYTKYQIQIRQPGFVTSTESLAIKVWYVLKRYDN